MKNFLKTQIIMNLNKFNMKEDIKDKTITKGANQ